MNRHVKVNTFQKNFDSLFRNIQFIWKQGHIISYLTNRYQWYMYPKRGHVSQSPLHVDIETTAKCNLRCPMCANRHLQANEFNTYGHMDFDLFKKIIDQCYENNVYSIRLSWRGEVLLHPEILKILHYAKVEKRIKNVSFLTNGIMLKGDIAEALIDYGIDYISVSVDGLDEMYEKIRYPLKFNSLYKNLLAFKELKRKKKKSCPTVRITTLWPAIASDPATYSRRMTRVSDRIVFNPLKDYRITTQDKQFICQFPWERLFIGFDGKVHACSNTIEPLVVGDINKQDLHTIWHGSNMQQIRKLHRNLKRLEIPQCSRCSYGVDYQGRWHKRDWTKWNPDELTPTTPNNPIKGRAFMKEQGVNTR